MGVHIRHRKPGTVEQEAEDATRDIPNANATRLQRNGGSLFLKVCVLVGLLVSLVLSSVIWMLIVRGQQCPKYTDSVQNLPTEHECKDKIAENPQNSGATAPPAPASVTIVLVLVYIDPLTVTVCILMCACFAVVVMKIFPCSSVKPNDKDRIDTTNSVKPTPISQETVNAVNESTQLTDKPDSNKAPPYPALDSCIKVKASDSPSVYLLPLNDGFVSETDQLRKCYMGKPGRTAEEKVIMVVGATGAGKTTLINGMINYVLGVDWADDHRFKMVVDQEEAKLVNQNVSQTRYITACTLHHHPCFTVPYSLTIIDTPGFGDSRGINQDKQTVDMISKFFNTEGEDEIDHINAIGIVVQASNSRLTPAQKFIFDSVLSLFGNDVVENIFLMVTFADGQTPPVLSAVKSAQVPFNDKYFKFNNSALFASKPRAKEGEKVHFFGFDYMFWEMGKESFRVFFNHLQNTPDKSLTLTKNVLDERKKLETHISGMHVQVQSGLCKLEQLQTEIEVLKQHQTDIDKNKSFTSTVIEVKAVLIDIESGTYVTNCISCNFTCHWPCGIPEDGRKSECAAMCGGSCTVCPKRCHWTFHKNMAYRIERQRNEVTKTSEDLKRRYDKARSDKTSAESLVEQVAEEFKEVQMHVLYLTGEIRKSVMRLRDIALRPDPLSATDYIDILIESEKNGHKDGWKERVQQLEIARRQALLIYSVEDDNFDPFKEYDRKHKEYLKQKIPVDFKQLFATVKTQGGNFNKGMCDASQ